MAKVTFATARKLALQLPNVEESTGYGKPALKVSGKMFACLPSHKSAEPDSLVVRVDFDQRAELLAGAPDVYYITPHYEGYPAVLVRMPLITPDQLKDLLTMAYRFVLRDKSGRATARRAGREARPTQT
jgi:hypothetical protein